MSNAIYLLKAYTFTHNNEVNTAHFLGMKGVKSISDTYCYLVQGIAEDGTAVTLQVDKTRKVVSPDNVYHYIEVTDINGNVLLSRGEYPETVPGDCK